ncbi:MAG: sortase [Candidatus Peribacteria bacterium]|nr:sortase [Candidatus Peribacteria bacterium]
MVESSYETTAEDVGVLAPGYGKHLTLITCIPIGTTANRWIVRAKISEREP